MLLRRYFLFFLIFFARADLDDQIAEFLTPLNLKGHSSKGNKYLEKAVQYVLGIWPYKSENGIFDSAWYNNFKITIIIGPRLEADHIKVEVLEKIDGKIRKVTMLAKVLKKKIFDKAYEFASLGNL